MLSRCFVNPPLNQHTQNSSDIPIVSKSAKSRTSELMIRTRNAFSTFRYCIFLLLLGFHFKGVDALPSFLNPVGGNTLPEEIQCYGIPYGGIGFVSHLLTYYTLGCLWKGRQPMRPWLKLEWAPWDCTLGVITLLTANLLAIFTIIRCRNRWEFVLIAVWKICLSITLGCSAVTSPILAKVRKNDKYPTLRCVFWIIPYIIGLIIGMVGLGTLVNKVWQTDHRIQVITYAFAAGGGGIVLIMFVLGIVDSFQSKDDATTTAAILPVGAIAIIVFFGVLYSDWILGIIANNLTGFPSDDIAILFWCYFAVKRLPLLSF
jgi:hypothetical protein